MRHEEFQAAFLSGELDETHFAHLSSCETCRADQAELSSVAAALSDPDLWSRPPEDLADRVVATVNQPGSSKTRRPWGRIGFAAAAALLVGVALIFGSLTGRPDWTVALDATELAPGATATVNGWNTDAGTRVSIAADGLEPAPDGFVYELWFSSEDLHVSGGTFTEAGEVTSWVGVSRKDYPRVWITVEELTGDPGPSRATVLDTGF